MAETLLTVRVKPGAKRAKILAEDGVVTVRVTARPVDGKANDAVRRELAQALSLPPSAVRLVRGARSREKTFAIDGRGEDDVARWRAALPGPPRAP